MASQTTNLPLQSGKGSDKQSVKVQVSIDPDNPGQPPSVIDIDTGSVIGQWDSNANAFVATVDGSVGNNQPISEFLAQNQSQLKQTTTNSINDLSASQKKGFVDGGLYTTGVQGSSATPAGDGTATAKPKSIQGGNQPPQVTLASLSGQGASLRYPSTISGDFVLFEIFEYNGSKVNVSKNFGLTTLRKGNAVASIALPIQASIVDSNTVDWKEDTLNAFNAAGGAAALGILGVDGQENAVEAVVKALADSTKSKDGKNLSPLAQVIAVAAASQAVSSNLRSRFTGEVMNPNLELLFNGPRLRSFNFGFLMSARDEGEATTIKKIIRTFKQKMAVRDGAGSLFLKAPHIFQITYKTDKGATHPSINQIKLCAMTGLNVNYTPAGTYSTFEDLTMTAYQMTMQFTELDPVYETDYALVDPNEIGF